MKYCCIFLLLLAHLTLSFSLHSQCDPSISPSDNPRLKYQPRKNRCEGMFKSPVGSTGLKVVGFTLGVFQFKNDINEVIQVSMPTGRKDTVSVRAECLSRSVYYRMDAEITKSKPLEWEVATVLWSDPRTQLYRNIGLYGMKKRANGDPIYVPLVAKSKLNPLNPGPPTPRLCLISNVTLQNVKWRLEGQKEFQVLKKGKSIPAGEVIVITLPASVKGRKTIEVQAREYNKTKPITRVYEVEI